MKIVELVVDDNAGTVERYGVRSFPTLMVFKHGEPTAIKVGAVTRHELRNWIQAAL